MPVKILQYIFNRLGIALIATGLICYVISDHKMIANAYVVRTLNRAIPNSVEYTEFIKAIDSGTPKKNNPKIKAINHYYRKITEFKPNMTDAWGLLGASYYMLDKPEKAIGAYQQALKHAPDFFWYPYNLGVIYLKSGDYKNALVYFQKATSANSKKTIYRILNSPMIYAPLVRNYRKASVEQLQTEYITTLSSIPKLETYCYLKNNNSPMLLQKANIGLKADPTNKHFYLYILAKNASDNQNYDIAFNLAQEILKEDPYNIDALYLMRNIFKNKNQSGLVTKISGEIKTAEQFGRTTYEDNMASLPIKPY